MNENTAERVHVYLEFHSIVRTRSGHLSLQAKVAMP